MGNVERADGMHGGAVTELRPTVRFSPPAYARWLAPLAIVVVVLSPGDQIRPVLVGLAIGVALLIWNVSALASARLTVRGGELSYAERSRERRLGGVGALRVVRVHVRGAAHPEWQIWAGADGVAVLVEQAWGGAELLALAEQLGAELVTVPDPVSIREVADRYPGALPWYAKHVRAASALLALGGIAGLVLIDSL